MLPQDGAGGWMPRPEEAQRAFRQDGAGHRQGRRDQHRAGDVGGDVAEQHPRLARAGNARRRDVVARQFGQRRRARQARHADPAEQGEDGDEAGDVGCRFAARQAEAAGVHRRQHHQERQRRQGEHPVRDPHQHGVRPAAAPRREQADRGAERRRGHRHREADQERDARAEEEAEQDVAPQLVRAERVAAEGGPWRLNRSGVKGSWPSSSCAQGAAAAPAARGRSSAKPSQSRIKRAAGSISRCPRSAARVASMVTAEASSSASSARL
jgi:hypothetical protein